MKGPYYKSYSDFAIPNQTETWNRRWYRTNDGQLVRTPLPYRYNYGVRLSPFVVGSNYRGVFPANFADAVNPAHSYVAGLHTYVHNKAYAKWVDKVRGGLQLGADFAEGNQTLKMMRDSINALKNPLMAWRKAAASPPRSIAGGYLAWHFGVEPLVKEVYTLLELLERGIQKRKIVTAQAKGSKQVIQFGTSKSSRTVYDYHVTVRHSASALVTDENLHTLSLIGVTNPFSIAWEVIPYSFVVDWFYPVQLYLGQLDALLGVNIQNPYTTTRITLKSEHVAYGYPEILTSDPARNIPARFEAFGFHRTLGVPAPVLQKTLNPWSTSLTRAMTSIALLVQAFPRR